MYRLSIVTPEKVVYEDLVYSLIAPGEEGYLEILTNHAAIITSLQPGKLTVTDKDEKTTIWAVSYGFLEVSHNEASLLADAIELPLEINLEIAEAALERAQQWINTSDDEHEIARAKEALQRAKNRIKIYHEFHS